MFSLLRPKKTKIDHEFSVDISSNQHGIYLEIDWHDGGPENLTLRFTPKETRDLIRLFEKELERQATLSN